MKSKEKTDDDRIEILIVEDSATQAVKLQFILEQKGYYVSTVRSGMDALVYLRDNIPTIIVSDIVMPEMDGYQFCQQVKKDENLKKIPFILLTSLSNPQDIIKGLECGANNFITKTLSDGFLLSNIQHVLENMKLYESEEEQKGVEIFFEDQMYFITSGRKQILDLLLSTYGNAVLKNRELIATQNTLSELNKRLEGKLVELELSEERFRALVQIIPDIVYKLDTDGKFTFVSNAIRKLGYEPEGLIGKHFGVIIHPTDIDNVSRSKALLKYLGKTTGDKDAPGLFDERRKAERCTNDLEVRLVPKGNREMIPGLVESLGEGVISADVNSSGLYEIDPDNRENVFVGSVGVIRGNTKYKETIGTVGVIRDNTKHKELEEKTYEYHTMSLLMSLRVCITGGDLLPW